MKILAHISDLHFGREDPEVAEGLVKDLHRLDPLLVVNSGDFTQRARNSQYRSAAGYIERLPTPQLNVPGNHDIPLFDVIRRFFSPLKRYKKFISDDLFPTYEDAGLMVLGINTARSFTWKSGRISTGQVRQMEQILSKRPNTLFKVVVTHHPFIPPPDQANTKLVGRAEKGLEVLERCGVDLLLAGHLHHGYTGDVRTFYPTTRRSIIVAQAGTAISHRVRHEPNAYNVIRLEQDSIEVEVKQWNGKNFAEAGIMNFVLKDGRWIPNPGNRPSGAAGDQRQED